MKDSDRPAPTEADIKEIEITPEMIEAGTLEMSGWNGEYSRMEVCVSHVLFEALTAGGYIVVNDTLAV